MFGQLTAIGLISGTSADGIDAAVVQTDGASQIKLRSFLTIPYPPAVRERILTLYNPGLGEIDAMGVLDRELGDLFADAALAACREAGIQTLEVHVIGSHGQTVRHRPPQFSRQIANPFVITTRTGVTTIADFRSADIAMGGEGAPLLPLFHQLFLSTPGERVAVVNIGGIANITALPDTPDGHVLAGDTGPGNSLIDLLAYRVSRGAQLWDEDGSQAAQGQVSGEALAWLLANPFFNRSYPRSTGREEFGLPLLERFLDQFPKLADADRFATLTRFTVHSIAEAARQLSPPHPQQLILCGGGANNQTIVQSLADALPETHVKYTDDFGIDADSVEAQAFAWFAVRTLRGLPSSLPSATRVKQPAVLGSIHPGRNWTSLLKKLHLEGQRGRAPAFQNPRGQGAGFSRS